MSLRKNAKWHLVDCPENMYLIPGIPARQRAQRKRICHFCESTIIQGEEHLAIWKQTTEFYPIRLNMCCLCAKSFILDKLKDVEAIYLFLKKQLKAVHKYSSKNNLDVKRMVERDL